MTREHIRENTMQLLYQMDINNDFDYKKLVVLDENKKVLSQKQALELLEIIKNHIDDIDKILSSNIENWSLNRVSKVDLAILRIAVSEIKYIDSIPAAVSINEAVELAKKYGDDKSYAFINSILSKIIKYESI